MRGEAYHRQREFRDPCFGGFVQKNAPPQTTLQVALLAWCDVQINPKSVRTHFEFLISAKLRRVGLQKNFRDVAVPKLIAAAIGFGIEEHCDDSVLRLESYKECLWRPL